ncbi:hypothetical protein [uncultured Shewanella sp.]|uniref:hypothetical protein n=1 Tax=uncultured Shewanella sp. TaxID=173975 RepID=UPI00262BEB19|nr:hypothetical protein [uncultured Shewanella sp.]
MLKKSLIALAISSVSMAASAATVVTPEALISNQGAVATAFTSIDGNNTNSEATDKISVTLNAEYKVDDIITVTFAGGDLSLANTAATSVITLDPVQNDAANSSMTLGLLSTEANKLTFRVTDLTLTVHPTTPNAVATTKGAVIDFGGLMFTNTSILASGAVNATYAAETSNGFPLDVEKTNTAALFSTADQFTAEVSTPLDAIIDVNSKRLNFYVNTTTNETVDDLVLTSTDLEGTVIPDSSPSANYAFSQKATPVSAEHIITGDFSFLGEADETTGVITTSNVTAFDDAGTPVALDVTVYNDRVEVATNGSSKINGGVTVTIDVEGSEAGLADAAIQTQKFVVSTELNYTDAATKAQNIVLLNDAAAGEWTLNGAVVHVPFMPFRDGYSPIVNVSNTSSQDGDIEVLVYAQNDAAWVAPKSYTLGVAAKAQAQTNITAALRDAGIEGDVAFDIIVNAPKENIEVSALYYNAGDRAVMNTTKK